MEMDVTDADRVEELTELASVFLSDLGGQRALVVHGDEESAVAIVQTFFGLTYEELDTLLFEFGEIAERFVGVYSDLRRGRHVLMASLRDGAGECLGWLYTDTLNRFPEEAFDSLDRFARHYITLLLEICVLRPALPRRRSQP
ncbi:hypothetical protein JST97_36910 [bacterium]|nr:hypothetical protein [bacterium]